MGLDAGYFTPQVCHGLEQKSIAAVMGYRTPNHKAGYFYKRQYLYDSGQDTYEELRAPMVAIEHIKNAVRSLGTKARISARKLTRKNPYSEKTGVYQQSVAHFCAFNNFSCSWKLIRQRHCAWPVFVFDGQ